MKKNKQTDLIIKTTQNINQIRNICIIAHVDSGKTTLSDSLVNVAGVMANDKVGDALITDTREDEQTRGITIKSVSTTLIHKYNDQSYLINLIDTPGHLDFTSEVTTSLRLCDGVILIIDVLNGVSIQTETVIRQTLYERNHIVLLINKIDRLITELEMKEEEIYDLIEKRIREVNEVINQYSPKEMKKDNYFNPEDNNVLFGSAFHLWVFSLNDFYNIYKKKLDETTFQKLKGKLFHKKHFCKILQNISKIYSICTNKTLSDKNCYKIIQTVTESLGIHQQFIKYDYPHHPTILARTIFRLFLGVAHNTLNVVCQKLPSPKTSQQLKSNFLSNQLPPVLFTSLIECNNTDPNKLLLYISKMSTLNDDTFVPTGRIYSGILRVGQLVDIILEEKTIKNIRINKIILLNLRSYTEVSEIGAGNIIGLPGLDTHINRFGTIVNKGMELGNGHITKMKYSNTPVIKVAVDPYNMKDIAKFRNGLEKLIKMDSLIEIENTQSGETIMTGIGQLHLEICINDLKKLSGIELNISEPIVRYTETVTNISDEVINVELKGYCIKMKCLEYNEELFKILKNQSDIEKIELYKLMKKFNYNLKNIENIWTIGSNDKTKTNILLSKHKPNKKIIEGIMKGFQLGINRGVIISEPVSGMIVEIIEIGKCISSMEEDFDNVDMSPELMGKIMKMGISMLMKVNNPRLIEPILNVKIICPQTLSGKIYNLMSVKHGEILKETTNGYKITYHCKLPVGNSFDFTDILRSETRGEAFNQTNFGGWRMIDDNPFEDGTYSNEIMIKMRKKKGIK